MSKRMRLTGVFRSTIPALSVLLLAACSTQPGSIFTLFNLEDGNSVSTGSRQRLVLNTSPAATPRPGIVQPDRVICAEPSPDVAATVANSFGAGISILGQGSGSISATQAEGIIQLAERTVTVQLLRDQMYRACEAYANGAITGTTYSLITSKNNKTMVSLLLGETAGGAVGRRSLGAIGTSATSSARAVTQGLKKNSDEAKQALEDKRQAQADLLAAQNADDKDAAKDAQQRIDEANEKLANATVATSESAAQVQELTAAGSTGAKVDEKVAAVLKEMQQQFLKSDFLEDYVSACLVELGLNSDQRKKNNSISRSYEAAQARLATTEQYWDNNPDSPKAKVMFELARADLETALLRTNNTFLSRRCSDTLPTLMSRQQDDNLLVAMKKLDMQTINGLEKTLARCEAIENSEHKATCQANTVSLISGLKFNLGKPISRSEKFAQEVTRDENDALQDGRDVDVTPLDTPREESPADSNPG